MLSRKVTLVKSKVNSTLFACLSSIVDDVLQFNSFDMMCSSPCRQSTILLSTLLCINLKSKGRTFFLMAGPRGLGRECNPAKSSLENGLIATEISQQLRGNRTTSKVKSIISFNDKLQMDTKQTCIHFLKRKYLENIHHPYIRQFTPAPTKPTEKMKLILRSNYYIKTGNRSRKSGRQLSAKFFAFMKIEWYPTKRILIHIFIHP